MSDISIRQDVLDELEFEPSLDAAHIGVAVENGVATLSGHVASYAEKLAVEQAVRRVKGVKAIAEEIEVRYPGDKRTADDEIAARALSILRWSAVVPADSVMIKVQAGWVTLSGQLNWDYQRRAAEAEVRRLSGVSGVKNAITIKPLTQASDVKRKIEDALKRSAELQAQKISVLVQEGGKITLEGQVRGWQERAAAERAAWSAPGVVKVEDHLRIA
jgi:osmotically-inducible protein OsmY